MKLKKTIKFTTQWEHNNVLIEGCRDFLSNFFLKVFFKAWISRQPKNYEFKINFKFSDNNKSYIKTPLFNYQRKINNNKIITVFYKPKILRAFVRSMYKFTNRKASVVGIPELYMAIMRKAIIEPIEYFIYQNGWKMIHASTFKFNNKLFVITAESKAGKSSFVSKLIKDHNCEILSDNYCFIKGDIARTIEEPLRGGSSSRFKMSFYKRSISGYPNCFEGEIDALIIMNRGKKNQLSNLNFEKVNFLIDKMNNKEREGIHFLTEKDPLRIFNDDIKIEGNFETYKLEVAEGLININTAINLIKKI